MPKRADRNLDDSTNTNHEGSGDNDMTVSGVRVDRDRRRYVSSAQRPEGRAAARWKQASVLERLRWGFVGPSRRTNTKTLRLERADPSGTVAAKVTPPRSRPEDLKIVIENDILEVRSPEGIQWQLKLPTGTPSGNVQITPEGHQLVIRIVDRSQAEQTSWEHQPTRIEEPPTRASLDVDPPEDLRELAGLLAADAHEKWLEQRRAQGWIHGPVRDDIQMTHPDLVPYSELPEAAKEYDRRFAEATLRTMLSLGVALDRVDFPLPAMPEIDLPDDLRELTELLAADAHQRWLEQRRAQGWIHGPVRDDIQMTHPDLVPYSELPEAAKEYERRFAEATLRTMLRLGVALDRVDLSLPPMPETDLPDTLHELAERLAGDAHEKWLVT